MLTVTTTGIARIVAFADPGLVIRFGFPPGLPTDRPATPAAPDGPGRAPAAT